MTFAINRTSNYDNTVKPCEEATPAQVDHIDTRTCTEEYYDKHFFAEHNCSWRDFGTGHCTTHNGCIRRTAGNDDIHTIEVSTLEELMLLSKKYGRLIVSDANMPCIEIYDDWRE